MLKTSFVEHKRMFALLAPFIQIQEYKREGGQKHPRLRIELRNPTRKVRTRALAFTMGCVACGEEIYPFRERAETVYDCRLSSDASSIYFAATCPLQRRMGCSRTRKATDEYTRVAAAVKAAQR